MNPSTKTAKRIAYLRKERGYSQEVFCQKFSEFESRKTPMAIMTVSAWETGRKQPPASVFLDLALFYGVSTDYLFGLSDEISLEKKEKSEREEIRPNVEIKWTELEKFNEKPIYVEFENQEYESQWGILDYPQKRVIFKNFKMMLTKSCKYSYALPLEEITLTNKIHNFLSMRGMMNADNVWVESLSKDAAIRAKLTGWYRHSEDRTFLINATGQTLPYAGLGVTYNAIDYK